MRDGGAWCRSVLIDGEHQELHEVSSLHALFISTGDSTCDSDVTRHLDNTAPLSAIPTCTAATSQASTYRPHSNYSSGSGTVSGRWHIAGFPQAVSGSRFSLSPADRCCDRPDYKTYNLCRRKQHRRLRADRSSLPGSLLSPGHPEE